MITYAEQIKRIVHRSRAFYRRAEPGHYLINVQIPADFPTIPALSEFNLEHQLGEWLDYNLAAHRPLWRVKEGLDDDAIPSISPFFGIAEHSAWLGLDVLLQETTCLPVPLVETVEDIPRLTCDTGNLWFRRMRDRSNPL